MTTYSVRIIAALLILVIGKWLARRITNLITRVMEKNKIDITLVRLLDSIMYYSFMVMVVIAAAGQLGINTTSFLTIVGAAGLAIGLALKDSLANVVSGVMLVLFRPYKVSDFVEIGGVSGNVVGISLFTTELNTGDNQKVIVPLIAVSELADSSVNFVVRPWVKTGDSWDVYFALHENIKLALDANGISIPFPQQDVHMYRESKE